MEISGFDDFVSSELERSFEGVLEDYYGLMADVFDVSGPFDLDLQVYDIGSVNPLFTPQGFFVPPNKIRVDVSPRNHYVGAQCCNSCWGRWIDNRKFILAHELGHYFNYLSNPESHDLYVSDKSSEEGCFGGNDIFLGELVAEVSALRFFDLGGRYEEGFEAGFIDPDDWGYGEPNYSCASRKFYERHRDNIDVVINYLARSSYEEVSSAIEPYRSYLRTICGMPFFIEFGICGGESEIEV